MTAAGRTSPLLRALGRVAVGVLAIGLLVGWIGGRAITQPLPARPVKLTPAAVGVMPGGFTSVRFSSAGGSEHAVTLVGWHVPGTKPETVVICHGRGDSREGMLGLIQVVHELGYTSFVFDFRAHGESGGDWSTVGAAEQQDLIGALDWIDTHAPAPLAVFGYSMGGGVALSVAARDTRVRGVVTEGAIHDVPALLRTWYGPAMVPVVWTAVPWVYLRTGTSLYAARPVRTVAQIAPRPVLIIHSRADRVVPFISGEALYAAAREPKEFWVLKDARHISAIFRRPQEFRRRLSDFFARAFAVAPRENTGT